MPIPMQGERRVGDQIAGPAYVKVQSSPEDFGAGQAAAIGQAGQTIAEIQIQEKQKADAFAAANLDAEYSRQATDVLYNPQTGFLTKSGGAALDVEPVLKRLQQLRDKIAGTANNDDQYRAFMARTND